MKRVLTLICLLAFAGTAFAQFSLGFKQVELPTLVDDDYMSTMDMNMLRIGTMASPQIRVEGYLGYAKDSFEYDEEGETYEYDGTAYTFGGGGYYIIAAPANTSFSFGLQFLYGSTSSEMSAANVSVDGPSTSAWCLDPLMRIDFAIPGAERLAFFTEFGGRYASATTTYETVGGNDQEYNWSGMQTYSPANILAGAYYVF
ncbi:MAG: hypothetical protein R6U39_09690 [Candidatus Aegiribacteria sp.]